MVADEILAGVAILAAGGGVALSRQISALRAEVRATFEGIQQRLEDHATVHQGLDGRLSRLEGFRMRGDE